MTATVRVRGREATVRGEVWSGDEDLVARVVALGPCPWAADQADPDHALAVWAVSRLGGEVVAFDPTDDLPREETR